MSIERLVLGTKNPAKIQEWKKMIGEFDPEMEVVEISDIGDFPDAVEDGNTFQENAKKKAKHFAVLSREYVFADDGGYEIDALGGAPGVQSKRILPGGEEGTDEELISFVLKKMESIPMDKRGVSLTSAVALSDPEGKIIFQEKMSSSGLVSVKRGPVRVPGYPFREIHFVPEYDKTYAELDEEERKVHSHKRPVAERLVIFLLE